MPGHHPRDLIPDFSYAGYEANARPLPRLPQITLIRSTHDDQDRTNDIQDALDDVAGRSGAVVLDRGRFVLNNPNGLILRGGNVVLRGSSVEDTVLDIKGSRRAIITIGDKEAQRNRGRLTVPITDAYVPVGAKAVSVKKTDGFKIGQEVSVQRHASEKWIHRMSMDSLVRDGKSQVWLKANSVMIEIRTIAEIDGLCLVFDVPLTDSIDASLDADGTVVALEADDRSRQFGLEHLTIRLWPSHSGMPVNSPAGAFLGLSIGPLVEDSWIRQVAIEGFSQSIVVASGASKLLLKVFSERVHH